MDLSKASLADLHAEIHRRAKKTPLAAKSPAKYIQPKLGRSAWFQWSSKVPSCGWRAWPYALIGYPEKDYRTLVQIKEDLGDWVTLVYSGATRSSVMTASSLYVLAREDSQEWPLFYAPEGLA